MKKMFNVCRGVLNAPVNLMIAVLLFCSLINAEQSRNEFSIYAGGGLSSLVYDEKPGDRKNSGGFHAGLGYTLFFNNHFGIGTGLEIAQYRAKYKIDTLSASYNAYDVYHREKFLFTSSIIDYEEKQVMTSLQVPLMFQFQIGKPDKHNFYAAFGGKGGISIDTYGDGDNTKIVTKGYYPHEDYTYTNEPTAGFGTYEAKGQKTDLDFRTSILASAEMGVKWKLKNNNALYTGIFIDHGLKNISKKPSEGLVEYNSLNPQEYIVNSALNSRIVDKVLPVAAGIKVKWAFGWGKIGKEEPVFEPEPEIVSDTIHVTDTVFVEKVDTVEKIVEVEKVVKKFNIRASIVTGQGIITPAGINVVNEDATPQYTFIPMEGWSVEQVTVNGINQGALSQYTFDTIKENQIITVAFKEDAKPVAVEIPREGLILRGVNFESGKAILTSDSYAVLDAVVKSLNEWSEVKIEVQGHTDSRGSYYTNMKLSKDRANTVMKYFIDRGISITRLRAVGFGPTSPIADNTTASGRELNRRVELKRF